MVAVAVNVRRIFILIGTTLVLTLWTTVFTVFVGDSDGLSLSWFTLFGVISAAIVIAGLWYAITVKRVTTL